MLTATEYAKRAQAARAKARRDYELLARFARSPDAMPMTCKDAMRLARWYLREEFLDVVAATGLTAKDVVRALSKAMAAGG